MNHVPSKKYRLARELSMEIWKYLYEHPWIDSKSNLPDELYNKIEKYENDCPLCELFWDLEHECDLLCPFSNCPCYEPDSLYRKWAAADSSNRAYWAYKIFDKIRNWSMY